MSRQSDTLTLNPDPAGSDQHQPGAEKSWQILIVDDDPEVDRAIRQVLANVTILGQQLSLHSANSALEAMNLLKAPNDIAVIVLKVVRESNDAGLSLVRTIRSSFDNPEVRIILCAARPEDTSEINLVSNYDINHYTTTQDLTPDKLLPVITLALRSYQQIRSINRSLVGLEREELRRVAYIDPLTQLANRNEFIRLLEVNNCSSATGCTAVLIDIDRFSDINHALGQDLGDQLLRNVAARLQHRFGKLADIARVDSDVFAMIGAQDQLTPERIYAVLKKPITLDENDIQVSVSLGFCAFTGEVTRGATILNRAFMALSMAKQTTYRAVAHYTPELESLTRNRLDSIRELREAFRNKQLTLYYQPQISLLSKRIVGAEALLRWPLENGDFVPPSVFIPLAEQSGLIVKMGLWVIERACEQLAHWQASGFDQQTISVNVSMVQFRSPEFVSRLRATVERYEFRRDALILEITESVIMDEPALVLESLRRISKLGLRISLDDFGIGFSSLSYLRQMPLDELKVEKSFINDMENRSGHAVIESIIQLSRRLGLYTVAEGVEVETQLNTVRALGCTQVQGFYYSPALSLPDFQQFMDTFNSNSPAS